METGPGALTFSLLLVAARCLDAFTIHMTPRCPPESLNWTEARLYCQKNHVDLVSLDVVDKSEVAQALQSVEVNEAWVLSGSSDWAPGQMHRHCAFVASDLKWHSATCLSKHYIYCTNDLDIKHYNMSLNWYGAYWYCYRDDPLKYRLATITEENTDRLTDVGWIGLYREAGDSWKWIGGETSDYRNWAPGEPINEDCGSFDSGTKTWHRKVCSEEHRFACYDDDLVVVTENKTWEAALSHCMSLESPCEDQSLPCRYRYELLSLERASDYIHVRGRISRAQTDEVWTGLRFLGGAWFWVDGQKLEHQGMLPHCPSQGKHCGTLSKYDTNNWITRDCSEQRNFICYKEKFFLMM